MTTPRARRIEMPTAIRSGGHFAEADYTIAYELPAPDAAARSAEQWARATFEGAPAVLRPVLVLGWKFLLGMRMGPRPSAKHVLGWLLADPTSDSVTLTADSALMGSRNTVLVRDSGVVWATLVRYDRPLARPVWTVMAPVHRLTICFLLWHAARNRD